KQVGKHAGCCDGPGKARLHRDQVNELLPLLLRDAAVQRIARMHPHAAGASQRRHAPHGGQWPRASVASWPAPDIAQCVGRGRFGEVRDSAAHGLKGRLCFPVVELANDRRTAGASFIHRLCAAQVGGGKSGQHSGSQQCMKEFHQKALRTGRMMISLVSTSSGWGMADWMARAMASGLMAILRNSFICSRPVGSAMLSASSDSVTPGLMVLTRMSVFSWRNPSEMAHTAYLVAQ